MRLSVAVGALTIGDASIDLEVGRRIDRSPRLFLASSVLSVGPYLNWPDREAEGNAAVGGFDWLDFGADDLLFRRDTGQMFGLKLWLSSRRMRVTDGIALGELPVVQGLPVLQGRNFFAAPSTRFLEYRSDGSILSLTDDSEPNIATWCLVEVAPDIGLVFEGGRYIGWSLQNAASRLASSDQTVARFPGQVVSDALGAVLELMSDQGVDRLDVGDCHSRGEILAIRDSLEVDRSDQAEAVRQALIELRNLPLVRTSALRAAHPRSENGSSAQSGSVVAV